MILLPLADLAVNGNFVIAADKGGNKVAERRRRDGEEPADSYSVKLQKEWILQRMKEKGCRITKQRQLLLDVILQGDCASCKEIYYKAKKADAGIGAATVYRMINLLEEIGAISRKNMYKIVSIRSCPKMRKNINKQN